MDDKAEDRDAAEEVRRLRETIKNIVTFVVVVAILVLIWTSHERSQRNAERHAEEYVACVLAGRSDCR